VTKRIRQVFDLTAGLGGDAYRLASCGYRVEACERNPVVFALLVSGWQRAREEGHVPEAVAAGLAFRFADSSERFDEIGELRAGVYLDPMYPPPRRASALPKRALQVLRSLLGEDGGVEELVAAARARSPRVVVKRPRHAEPVAEGVGFEVETKLVRYDVYLDPGKLEARVS
jgi:16S rRNA (guanine1516-N2)-methyltransferase